AWLAVLYRFESELGSVEPENVQDEVDREILRAEIARERFALTEGNDAERNPLGYVGLVGDGMDPLVTRTFAPADERAKNLAARMRTVGPIFETAKKRLKNPPELHTKTAILQNKGLAGLVTSAVKNIGEISADRKKDLEQAAEIAKEAIEKFG